MDLPPLRGKTILLVNTGSSSITGVEHKKFIYKRIAELGGTVVVLNEEENLKLKKFKHWILCDLTNEDRCIKRVEAFMRKTGIKIDGAVTFYEDSVLLVSKLVEHFGWPGVPYPIADLVRNKYRLRSFCSEHHLPAPAFFRIRTPQDLETVKRKLTFPIVLKPIYGASSAFVVKVEEKADLPETYEYITKNISQKLESALGNGFEIMAEEYIDGDEVDINILIQNGRIKFFNITDNYQTNEPFFIETGMAEPSALPEEQQKALIAMADEVLDLLGVQDACLQFEAKSSANGPVPLEINLRMGGDEAYFFAKSAWGVDLIEGALKIATGTHLQKVQKPEVPKKYLAGETLHAPYSGVVANIEVDQEVEKEPFVENIEVFKEVGDAVLVPPFGYEYMGWVSVAGDNAIDAAEKLETLRKGVAYTIAKFDEGSSVGKTMRKHRTDNAVFSRRTLLGGERIEKIRVLPTVDRRKLHIGVAYNDSGSERQATLPERYISDMGRSIRTTLVALGFKVSSFDFNNPVKAIADLHRSNADIIFNVCDRINRTSLLEPHAASIFDILQIPYTGSSPSTLGLCLDKIKVKKMLDFHKIPTPSWDYVHDVNEAIREDLEFPLIVKPANTDNSVGISNDSVVTNKRELRQRIAHVINRLGSPALVEEYIEGDEYAVVIVGNAKSDIRVLPLTRTDFSGLPKGRWHIKTLEAKFGKDPVYKRRVDVQVPPKKVSPKLISLLSEIALDAFNIFDCRDYGRIEFRVDENNNPYMLELNPNPSIHPEEVMSLSVPDNRFTYGDFLETILNAAILRYKERPPYSHLQSNLL